MQLYSFIGIPAIPPAFGVVLGFGPGAWRRTCSIPGMGGFEAFGAWANRLIGIPGGILALLGGTCRLTLLGGEFPFGLGAGLGAGAPDAFALGGGEAA